MNFRQTLHALQQFTREKLHDFLFRVRHKTSPEHFTRKSVVTFFLTMFFVLRLPKCSNANEVCDFLDEIHVEQDVSDDAIRKARMKISHSAFKEIYEDSVQLILKTEGRQFLKGRIPAAIDGTTFALESTSYTRIVFGEKTPQKGVSFVRGSICTDVLNGFILDAEIGPFSIGERKYALNHVEKNLCSSMLYLFDRGYWSSELVAAIIKKNQEFVMRVSSTAVPSVTSSEDSSGYFDMKYKGKTYTLRFHKFELPGGNMEYLVSNLSAEEFSDEELAQIYHLRWGVETKYFELKTQLELEHFSGKLPLFVKQDFFATMFMSNLVALVICDAEEQLKEKDAKDQKNLKNQRKINRSFVIHQFSRQYVDFIELGNIDKADKMIDKLIERALKNTTTVRKDKKNPPRGRSRKKPRNSKRTR